MSHKGLDEFARIFVYLIMLLGLLVFHNWRLEECRKLMPEASTMYCLVK